MTEEKMQMSKEVRFHVSASLPKEVSVLGVETVQAK